MPVPNVLYGPPDLDAFRTTWYRVRHYVDILPGCTIAPVSDDRLPSVTAHKKAWPRVFTKTLPTGENVPLDCYRAGRFTVDNFPAVAALVEAGEHDAAVALIAGSAGRALSQAGQRGTGVHEALEAVAAGRPIGASSTHVAPFLPAVRAFVADLDPQWIAVEVIAFNRTLSYAGTFDAVLRLRIDGETWVVLVDWKTRGGEHGAYPEEAAQLGAYSLAEYWVVTNPQTGLPVRVLPFPLDRAMIVSLTAHDGYRLYPVDLDQARDAFRAMHCSYVANRDGQKAARAAIGQPLTITPEAAVVTPTPSGQNDSAPTSREGV